MKHHLAGLRRKEHQWAWRQILLQLSTQPHSRVVLCSQGFQALNPTQKAAHENFRVLQRLEPAGHTGNFEVQRNPKTPAYRPSSAVRALELSTWASVHNSL
jgi:hypothetical protein